MEPNRSLVRVATAGSVDDGKSTLIGRLLYETDSLLDDQLETLREASTRLGHCDVHLALVTDGLRAEREQNITIDVAYRSFATQNRRFLLADSPGHVEYTRNMVTGASTADIVIVLADASRGETKQSRRHLAIASLLRTPLIVIAVNKMDLVGYDESIFNGLRDSLTSFGAELGATRIEAIPMSALRGDNVCAKSDAMPWYSGKPLLALLDEAELSEAREAPACLAVQCVLRADDNQRFYAGSVSGSEISVGDALETASEQRSVVKEILVGGTPVESCPPRTPCAVRLADELDISRGDWLIGADRACVKAAAFQATLFWLQPEALRLGMTYQLRQGPRVLPAKVKRIEGQLDLDTGAFSGNGSVSVNDICRVEIELSQPAFLELYGNDREAGSFILIDPRHQTIGAGCIEHVIETAVPRRESKTVLWLTGLSGAGKSTIAQALTEDLRRDGIPVMNLDGDSLRSGLNSDLGFTEDDRQENVRRTAEVAKLFAENGAVTICSLISPAKAHRDLAREILGESFVEIYVKCELNECIRRDVKGLYARAISGAIPRFTGISAPYEAPESPALIVETEQATVESCVGDIRAFLERQVRI